MARLFITAHIPEKILGRVQALECKFPGARPTAPDQLHLTLRFIGEVEELQLEEIQQTLAEVVFPSFSIQLQGVGFFGKKGPTVLWLGAAPVDKLQQLKSKVDGQLRPLGIAGDGSRFRPHITLARLKNCHHRHLQQFLEQYSQLRSPEFMVDSFDLYSSQLTPKRALHTLMASYPLQIKLP